MYIIVYGTVYSTVYTVVYSAVYSLVFSIYMKQGISCSSGNKSAGPANLTSGISLLYIAVYNVQYSVHFTFQYSKFMGGIQVLSEMWLYSRWRLA